MSVERQQGRAYQGDLFDEALLKALRPDASGDGGTEPAAGEESQALAALAWGITRTGSLLRQIAPVFERSDVNAQLLRVRLIAHYTGLIPLDEPAAREEAERIAAFQAESFNSRLSGGFWFGRKGGEMLPFSNPVSTAFCAQALALWDDHKRGQWSFSLAQLI